MCGLYWNYFDVNLEQYNGRKGRVSREPPPWVIKAVGATAGEHGTSSNRAAERGGLVPVLLDCRRIVAPAAPAALLVPAPAPALPRNL